MAVIGVAAPKTLLFKNRLSLSWAVVVVPLLAILALQSAVAASLSNTAFQDEALYLYAGRQIFDHLLGGPPVIEPYARYFSGLPYLYPVLAGALDQFVGLEGARLFSLVCMLYATIAVFTLTRHFFGRDSALLAAALFAVQGPVLFLSHLATFDSMCLALLAFASVLTLRVSEAQRPFGALLIGAVLILAAATKYAGLLFVPTVLALLFWQTRQTRGWIQAVVRVVLAVGVMVVGIAVLAKSNSDIATGLSFTTLDRQAMAQAPRELLFRQAASWGGGLTLLAMVGLVLSVRRYRFLAVVLLGTAFLAPAYHIYKGESVSLQKHVAFGLLFAAPLAGYALARFCAFGQGALLTYRWLAGLAICLLLFGFGVQQAQSFYSEWPNATAMVDVLRTQVRPDSGRILAEEDEVPRYYLQSIVSFWQWNQLDWFYYTDRKGQQLQGIPAYKAAIADGYFDLVVFRYGPNAPTAVAIDGGLRSGRRYELIARLPFSTSYGGGDYWVWRKRSSVPVR